MKMSFAAALAAAALASPAGASVLYKSVDANGTVTFSDMPPADGARLIESRPMAQPSSGAELALPQSATAMEQAFHMIDYDRALRDANERVDLAERALAQARAAHATTRRPGLNEASFSLADQERVEFYKRDLRAARMALTELLRSRQLASGRPLR